MTRIRIFIADDHEVVRTGLKTAVHATSGIAIVGEASTGADVLARIRETHADVLVMDIGMPGRSGVEILPEVRALCPDTAVLIYTLYGEDEFGPPTLLMGAAGYVTKAHPISDVIKAIRVVASGQKYVSPSLAQYLVQKVGSPTQESLAAKLSPREQEIMRGIAQGQPLTKIAEAMGVKARTVSTYRGRLLVKLNMNSNAELTRYFYRLNPPPPDSRLSPW